MTWIQKSFNHSIAARYKGLIVHRVGKPKNWRDNCRVVMLGSVFGWYPTGQSHIWLNLSLFFCDFFSGRNHPTNNPNKIPEKLESLPVWVGLLTGINLKNTTQISRKQEGPKNNMLFLGAKLYFQQNDTRTSSECCSLVAKLKTYTPRKLTWNLKINQLKRKVIFQTSMFGFNMLIFQVYVQCKKTHKPISIWNSPKTLWQCQGRTRTCWIGGRSYPEFWKKNFPKTIPNWWTISGTLRVLWIVISNKYGPHHKYCLWFDATTSGPMAGTNDFVFRWFICCSFPKMWPPQRLVC